MSVAIVRFGWKPGTDMPTAAIVHVGLILYECATFYKFIFSSKREPTKGHTYYKCKP